MQTFLIPDEFRAFMKAVVVRLQAPSPALDAERALEAECGHGSRIDGADTFAFEYITRNNHRRWDLVLKEAQIRDIADGLLIEVEAEPFDLVRDGRREASGDPLLVWGEYPEDALQITRTKELSAALEALHTASVTEPRLVRLWTAADDQLVAVLAGDRCALYVVESPDGYATSMGDATEDATFEVPDHEGHPLTVPVADCVSWDYARRAIFRFVDHSDLGDVPTEGRIPSLLLMMGDVDRKAVLSARALVTHEVARTSLGRGSAPTPGPPRVEDANQELVTPIDPVEEITAPVELVALPSPFELAGWSRRLREHLGAQRLIELDHQPNLDELDYQLGTLLVTHAAEAERSVETADWLANEIGMQRGIARLYATGTDLQIALRRTREE